MTNPRALKPGELCRLLNSTPLGPVISDRRLRAHRERAGLRIGDGGRVDLFRYAAWLFQELSKAGDNASRGGDGHHVSSYARKRDREAQRSRDESERGRDIGPIPDVVDPQRRAAAAKSLKTFCETYFPETFYLPWSSDQLRVVATIEKVVREGGQFALAMPRGTGKTALATAGAEWALLNGYRRFVVLIGESNEAAIELIDDLKTDFEANELLLEDFPEVCYPIRCLDGITQRQKAQTCLGEPTRIALREKSIRLPTIAGSRASGAIVRAAGINARIRGMRYKLTDGSTLRPDVAIIDDPQTAASAKSELQIKSRIKTISSDILRLPGPDKTIAAIMPCTVIQPDDVADQLLNREKHPEWNGERTKLLYAFPTNMALWEQYREIRADSFRRHGDAREATAFYRANRAKMDEGAQPSWPERFESHQISAVQYAMDIWIDDPQSFFSEFQNEPEIEGDASEFPTTADVAAKRNGLVRGVVPLGATVVTAFIDVQGKLLYWLVAAWSPNLTGAVIDYGTYPDQKRRHFTLRDARHTLAKAAPRAGFEGRIYAGLDTLTRDLLAREWTREDGTSMRIQRCLIDSGWGTSTETVYTLCRTSPHAAVLAPSKGKGITKDMLPLRQYKQRPGEVIGDEWIVSAIPKAGVRLVTYDTNHWKTWCLQALGVPLGDPGCLSLFERDPGGRRSIDHKLLAEHLTNEKAEKKPGRGGRVVYEWTCPKHLDNHWLDCLVGSAVAASLHGCKPLAGQVTHPPVKKRRRPRGPEYF